MMRNLVTAMILLSALSLPLAGQARPAPRSVASYIAWSKGSTRGSSGYLFYFGEPSGLFYEGLSALIRAEELAEMRIDFNTVPDTDPSYAMLIGGLGLAKDSVWALAGDDGHCLMQGSALPGAAALRRAMDDAGIKSPAKVLRDFLKLNPGHIDARVQLLGILRKTAEERTKQALRLKDEDIENSKPLFSDSAIFDTSAFDGKKLDPEQDIVIWAPYAQELETLFASGDWRFVCHDLNFYKVPVEACSPTMIGFYGRHMSKVEQCLEEDPHAKQLWELYGWMYSISKRASARSLLDRLTPSPTSPNWPSGAPLNYLVVQERAKGNWGLIANTLWEKWPTARLEARRLLNQWSITPIPPDLEERVWRGVVDGMWNNDAKPLLEALIKINRSADAEAIICDLAKLPNLRGFQRRAAELALELGREDLQKAWLALQIPEKPKGADLDDLDVQLSIHANSRLILAVANGENFFRQIWELIYQDRIIGYGLSIRYRLNTSILNAEFSELLQKREGWPEKETHWALLDKTGKTLASGPGLPDEDTLHRALESSGALPLANLLRRFVSEHPSHFGAKLDLLDELMRLASRKTIEKIGNGAGRDKTAMLSDDDDRNIWGEYASLYHEVIAYMLEYGRTDDWGVAQTPFQSDYFIHSKRMMALARSMLPQLEACLKRQPLDRILWKLWSDYSSQLELRQTMALKASLMLPPFSVPLEDSVLPGAVFRSQTLRNLFVPRADWLFIIDLQKWRWEEALGALDNFSRLSEGIWAMEWGPLLEAYLRLGRDGEANEIVRVSSQSYEWEKIKQTAIGLAKNCGKDTLAEQWGKL